jgi:type II restriction/modification system DNA methylase subunit YeeA
MQVPQVGPEAVLGIEINAYAAELARVTIWIGEIQWMIRHGLGYRRDPILRPLHHIETRDALLDLSDPANPREAEWPEAEFIVGNPPFLGRKFLREQLGDTYVDALYTVFEQRVPHAADFVCYWHEKARAQVGAGFARRAGLLATQNIRGGPNRRVLRRIKQSGDIFFARADDPWVLAGANVHISFIGQDDGTEGERELDGVRVTSINPDLTAGLDLTTARRLTENVGIAFQGVTLGGPFSIDAESAAALVRAPNPDGRSSAAVVRRLLNAMDITARSRNDWVIDFGVDTSQRDAALYEAPFEYVRQTVRPVRGQARTTQKAWWLHERPRADLRRALSLRTRVIATPITAKHRLFVWVDVDVLPSVSLTVITRDDDYMFGVLHSRVHELWALAMGTQLETRPRYTPTTCFETFPFPDPTPEQRERVGEAARRLVELRDGWLNPPGLDPADLARRTLTNLYNQRPTWLANAHADLDTAVLAAYGWPDDLTDTSILGRLLALNLERSSGQRANEMARGRLRQTSSEPA